MNEKLKNSGLNGTQSIFQGAFKNLPKLPAELENVVFVDIHQQVAYCIKDVDKTVLRQFRSYVSLLNKTGFSTTVKSIAADQFHSLKREGKKSERQSISDMQNVAVKLFKSAASKDASDIHIIDHGTYGEVFFRINGDLSFIKQFAAGVAPLLFNAVYTSMTDIAEPTYKKSQPQKARIKENHFLPSNVHSIRVASCPQVDGSFMVFRFLYQTEEIPFEDLGYSKELGQQSAIRLMQKRPHGLIILSGPTGSGKSTSLKHILTGMKRKSPQSNFITVEDPPEYPMPGIRQVPVIVDAQANEAERRQAYNTVLDALLRLDPDYLMVGEIRDKASAELAVLGAMTGHPVWGTLHANDPFNIITRLVRRLEHPNALQEIADVGIISGLIFQKLVKTLCPHCKINLLENIDKVSNRVLDRLSSHVKFDSEESSAMSIKGPGCDHCFGTGIGGRTLLAETVCPDHQTMEKILKDGVGSARRFWLKRNGHSIIDHAVEKIIMGIVDPAMAEQVVGPLTLDQAFSDSVLDAKEVDELSS